MGIAWAYEPKRNFVAGAAVTEAVTEDEMRGSDPSGVATADPLLVGLDVGSTTVKLLAYDIKSGQIMHSAYRRHHARQSEGIAVLLEEFAKAFSDVSMHAVVTGSGGIKIAEALGVPYMQEVVANVVALRRFCPQARTAIELGGQDAKVVFFSRGAQAGQLEVDDMRMNGTCAGGTGAFLDEIAALLKVPIEDFDTLAGQATAVYPVSGRCGVFAKTDMQPLISQGVSKADLALSSFHAIAKQTIGGLAQGHVIEAPVVFEGGPLLFNPTLVRVFAERLGLAEGDIVVPEHPEMMVALGAALSAMEACTGDAAAMCVEDAIRALRRLTKPTGSTTSSAPLFADDAERAEFERRHPREKPPRGPCPGPIRAYLGIDSGSTTTKLALIDEEGELLDSFYASNGGEPLEVAGRALARIGRRWSEAGAQLDICAVCTTGYGEHLFAEAYHADCSVVETVAHAYYAVASDPDTTFVLDIGGQDMKAIWLDDGVITDIVINEACSSGCGSFLEGFAASLGIERDAMAEAAFSSESPANLGSRCTVFMNSNVISAQRDGKQPADIIAGLSRSIVKNAFTKVIRQANVESLGSHVVVQGGAFANDAVLRAFEEHLGHAVTRGLHPGLAGAIGAALTARDHAREAVDADTFQSTFIGLDGVRSLEFKREQNVVCQLCANHCSRTFVLFSSGATYVTGNRCPRGAVEQPSADLPVVTASRSAPNLFRERERLLFEDYSKAELLPANGHVIGLPRVLAMWDDAPFWKAFFQSLGFTVLFSRPSERDRYEDSLVCVASDTACLPAKLAHSHVRDLVNRGVDRIFMPIITARKPEGASPRSESVCALVKGMPMVVRSSDVPEENWDVPLDAPLFHWHSARDREGQLARYMESTYGISAECTRAAIAQGDHAKAAFRAALEERGAAVMAQTRENGEFAVVLAGRPYHNDAFVNHGLPELITSHGVPVLTVDSLPGLDDIVLEGSRLDIVNNYHARMLRGALYVAGCDCLEYAQIVSFGCGHDAYLSDEIVRLMHESSAKVPLILKMDEGDIRGPLGIRVRSFLETVKSRRRKLNISDGQALENVLPDPYPAKFDRAGRVAKTVLVPNTSHAFSRLMAAVFSKQGLNAVPLPIGRDRASDLGKRYVHNDICYPAQMLIGEALEALESGRFDPDNTAIGMAKYLGDCRLTHYSALLRKALDDAGYPQVPIITNDDADESDMHPGFKMSLSSALRVAFCLPMIDALEELLRKMRPYEMEPGSADFAFERALDHVIGGVQAGGLRGAYDGFKVAVDIMAQLPYERSVPRPRVLVVGEYLLNFHPGANRDIERYLEDNGLEVVEARMTDVIRKTYFYQRAQVREFDVKRSLPDRAFLEVADRAFEMAHDVTDRIAGAHPLYEPPCRMPELVEASDDIVHHTFDAGEGVLIPAEVLHHYERGVRSFVILQPFGCLPNHVVGRGIAKSLRRRCPDAHILTLDYDPDVSFANVENRLQMLVMSAGEGQI